MNKIISLIVILSIIAITVITPQTSFATNNSKNYNNGFRDGLSDCHTDQSVWAMNLASNAGHHSADYLAGHDAGLAACNSQTTVAVSNQNSNNVDQNNRNQDQGQAITNPHQNCFTVIGNCSTTNALGQSLNN